MSPNEEAFEVWVRQQDDVTTRDVVWRIRAYRLGCYVQALAWSDVCRLAQSRPTRQLADQLYRAVGSIPANIAEGYSRSSRRDRCRVYEYALGSARESVVWYRGARPVLGAARVAMQHEHLQRIIRLVLTMIDTDRGDR